jgi:hypothetical protein
VLPFAVEVARGERLVEQRLHVRIDRVWAEADAAYELVVQLGEVAGCDGAVPTAQQLGGGAHDRFCAAIVDD